MGSEGIQDRYINPCTDFGFKKLFGTELNKELLISFLNALLEDEHTVKDVTYLNSEHLGTLERDRRAVFDVYCESETGEKFLVEMQRGEQQFFKDRSLYYTTFPIQEQATKGKGWDYELKAVYTIGILNFTFGDENDSYRTEVKLMNTRTKEVFYDKLTFIYLEIPKFNKGEKELRTMMDKWMYVLRNLGGLMKRPAALQGRIFTRLFKAAAIASFSPKELVEYKDSLKVYRDWFSTMKTQYRKGMAEGREEGLAEGLEKGKAEGREEGLAEGLEKGKAEEKNAIALQMKAQGIAASIISQCTGLSLEDVERL